MSKYFDKVCELKELFDCGRENIFKNKEYSNFPKSLKFIETRNLELSDLPNDKLLVCNFNPNKGECWKNIRINNEKVIRDISLGYYGQIIDRITSLTSLISRDISDICDLLRYIYIMDGLPFYLLKYGLRHLEFDRYEMNITLCDENIKKEDLTISYDVYAYDEESLEQYMVFETLKSFRCVNGSRIKLSLADYKRPIYYLISDHKLKKIKFDNYHNLELSEYYKKNGYYVYKFMPCEQISMENSDDFKYIGDYGINLGYSNNVEIILEGEVERITICMIIPNLYIFH